MAYDCANSLTKKNLIDYVHWNRKLNSMRIETLGTFKVRKWKIQKQSSLPHHKYTNPIQDLDKGLENLTTPLLLFAGSAIGDVKSQFKTDVDKMVKKTELQESIDRLSFNSLVWQSM